MSWRCVPGLALFLVPIALGSCEKPRGSEEVVDAAKQTLTATKEKVQQTAAPIAEWTEEDLRKIGAWEYRLLEINYDAKSPEDAVTELNELGSERWECFWVEATPEGARFYLKRSKRSYLRYVPVSDVMKLVVPGGSN